MGKPTVTAIPDKNLNFPNPRFVNFIKRMWNSEPVSQTEKDSWGAAPTPDPYAPVNSVSLISLPTVVQNTDYLIFGYVLPDLGDDLELDVVSASSSNFIEFTNGGPYNINGMVAIGGAILHFNLDLTFLISTSIVAVLDYKNGTSTEATVLSKAISVNDDGYVELFNEIRFNAQSPTNTIKIGLLLDKDANTINLQVTFNSGTNSSNLRIHQRFEIRRY